MPVCDADADRLCSKCTSPWDDSDPIVQDWCIQQNAVLLSRQSSKLVSVYYRPCSDRLVCLHLQVHMLDYPHWHQQTVGSPASSRHSTPSTTIKHPFGLDNSTYQHVAMFGESCMVAERWSL